MASAKIEKGSEEWMFFMDFWKFHQDYYKADNCDDWYVEMMDAGEKLIVKYSKTEFSDFARGLVFEHFAEVERKARNEVFQRKRLRETE